MASTSKNPSTSNHDFIFKDSIWYISLLYTTSVRLKLMNQIESVGGIVIKSKKPLVRTLVTFQHRYYVRSWFLEPNKKQERSLDAEESFVERAGFVNIDPEYIEDCLAANQLLSRSFSATPEHLRWLCHDADRFFARISNTSEVSQSFRSFFNSFQQDRKHFGPSSKRKKIYILQLLEEHSTVLTPSQVQIFSEGMHAFFSCDIELFSSHRFQITVEKGDTGVRVDDELFYPIQTDQLDRLFVLDLLDCLSHYIPQDAISILGLTNHSIYEWEEDKAPYWGRGCGDRCAIVSTFSFQADPSTPSQSKRRRKHSTKLVQTEDLQFSRLFNVIVHELSHTFHLDHCYYEYQCLMNSVEPLPELLDESLPLCSCCLAKLQHVFKFDILSRYHHLVLFFSQHSTLFSYEYQWYSQRYEYLNKNLI